ncbi:hypothetical protein [Actinomadura sp. KC216]|uniref:hypothetical protein n=1 Tax=Actinomadura sp. KC216 TaxID=2530370 RepID=UPI001A9DB8BA|nr:hypothetical protein [Actinomadura sp. KC216]
MTAPPIAPDRSGHREGRDGFAQVLHAEWTKFRTVRGWVTGTIAAALLVVLFALLAGISSDQEGAPPVPTGPGGEPVTDSFYFLHRPLTGDGAVTVSVSALTSSIPTGPGELRPGTVPWAKAGLIIKDGTRQGSPYAAIMVTGGHGVRMQDGYVHDTAGLPGPVSAASPRWLRLERAGDTITGHASVDGARWTTVGAVRVRGLGPTAQAGPFVASPPSVHGMSTRGTVSTAVFGDLRARGRWDGGGWTGTQIGPGSPTSAGYPQNTSGSVTASGGRLTVTGAGDIAPAVRETLPTGGTVGEILTGTFAALVAVIVVGALFITTEYRTNLIHLTLAAAPRRVRVLMAKAIVLGAVTFVTGSLLAQVVGDPHWQRLLQRIGPASAGLGVTAGWAAAALVAAALLLRIRDA